MNILKFGMVLFCVATLWGCSKGNSGAPPAIDPSTRYHMVANWRDPAVHGGLDYGASNNMVACQECHGTDFAGGISKVSCLNTAGCHGAGVLSPHPKKPFRGGLITHTLIKVTNAAVCAACHTKGTNLSKAVITSYKDGTPGCFNSTLCHDVVGHLTTNDPKPWRVGANHGANSGITGRPGAKFSIQACQPCHATQSAGQIPSFTLYKNATMQNGCSSVGCHDQNPNLAHPYGWVPSTNSPGVSHATAGDMGASCVLCHGSNLDGVAGITPSCSKSSPIAGLMCHFTKPVDAAGVTIGCISCHGGSPAGPNGASFPNTANAHPKHTAQGFTCDYCHNGGGIGTSSHATRTAAMVSLRPSLSRPGTTAAYDLSTRTCANVTCHVGTTPAWTSAGSGCTTCHTAPPDTGRHTKHFAAIANIKCDTCHNDGPGVPTHMTQISVVVGTPLPAKYNENGAIATHDPATGKCSNVICHGGQTVEFPAWKSGAAFDRNECARCHLTPTSLNDRGQIPQQYTGRYIGPFSGNVPVDSPYDTANNLHFFHLNLISQLRSLPPSKVCLACHTITGPHYGNIVNGRGDLVPGFAAGTIGGPATGITSYTFNGGTPPTSSCFTIPYGGSTGCHYNSTVAKSWY